MQPKYKCIFYLAVLLPFFQIACREPQKKITEATLTKNNNQFDFTYPRYAKGFRVKYCNDYKIVELIDLDDSLKVLKRFYLIKRGSKHASKILSDSLIFIPLRNVIPFTLTQIGFLNSLRENLAVCAIGGLKNLQNISHNSRLKYNQIEDIGNSKLFQWTKIQNSKPELLFMLESNCNLTKMISQKGMRGCKIIQTQDQLEKSPLARAEWIKFFSYFFNKEKLAESLFTSMENRYLKLKELANRTTEKPTVFLASFLENKNLNFETLSLNLLQDAGANCIFPNIDSKKSNKSSNTSFDSLAINADFINFTFKAQKIKSKKDFKTKNSPYNKFKAISNNNILYNSKLETEFEEVGMMQMDIILTDLIKLLHPELLSNNKTVYYSKLN